MSGLNEQWMSLSVALQLAVLQWALDGAPESGESVLAVFLALNGVDDVDELLEAIRGG